MGAWRDKNCEVCRRNDRCLFIFGVLATPFMAFYLLEEAMKEITQDGYYFWMILKLAAAGLLGGTFILISVRLLRRIVACKPNGHRWGNDGYCEVCWEDREKHEHTA